MRRISKTAIAPFLQNEVSAALQRRLKYINKNLQPLLEGKWFPKTLLEEVSVNCFETTLRNIRKNGVMGALDTMLKGMREVKEQETKGDFDWDGGGEEGGGEENPEP